MKTPYLVLLPLGLIFSGCQTLPVAAHAIKCDVSTELLAGKCATPRQITNDTTYAKLVDAMQADRKALQECGATADALRNALKRCNQATGEYNRKIDAPTARNRLRTGVQLTTLAEYCFEVTPVKPLTLFNSPGKEST